MSNGDINLTKTEEQEVCVLTRNILNGITLMVEFVLMCNIAF